MQTQTFEFNNRFYNTVTKTSYAREKPTYQVLDGDKLFKILLIEGLLYAFDNEMRFYGHGPRGWYRMFSHEIVADGAKITAGKKNVPYIILRMTVPTIEEAWKKCQF